MSESTQARSAGVDGVGKYVDCVSGSNGVVVMWGEDCRKFLNDELGGGTVMSLLWFILLVGITGVAVDRIENSRIRTMLQTTADADAAALGGAIDLSAAAAAVTSAVAYSTGNMPAGLYGSVLEAGVSEK